MVTFEEYLREKKIDSSAFEKAEGDIWSVWKTEFEQMHPSSFTAQKLYLINPIRRKYPLKSLPAQATFQPQESGSNTAENPVSDVAKPKVNKPVFKQKPKIN